MSGTREVVSEMSQTGVAFGLSEISKETLDDLMTILLLNASTALLLGDVEAAFKVYLRNTVCHVADHTLYMSHMLAPYSSIKNPGKMKFALVGHETLRKDEVTGSVQKEVKGRFALDADGKSRFKKSSGYCVIEITLVHYHPKSLSSLKAICSRSKPFTKQSASGETRYPHGQSVAFFSNHHHLFAYRISQLAKIKHSKLTAVGAESDSSGSKRDRHTEVGSSSRNKKSKT